MTESAVLLVATGFGAGWLPIAPGTIGTMIGLPLAWWLLDLSQGRQLAVMALLLAMAVPLCYLASVWLGGGDASQIVADEYLAFPVAVMALSMKRRLWVLVLAFLVFRLFDITKLPPINYLEMIGGGFGIVMDDLMAAMYTWIVLAIGLVFWRRYQSMQQLRQKP
ncbi:phosphatidylglycerophosphatase A [Allohahella marinimesophila]|uniref:Phosphatidylglycerophosphatase A n=1 Tax=Allohahella marinimesophila TaxID=1054972 RepID=A0ABP7NFQ1_9GAMM